MSRNTQGLKMFAIGLAVLTYVGAVVYGDIMFISVMQETFPSGFLGTLAIVGAVMTAVSAITLPLALHFWFSPGLQFIWGIVFWLVDIAALALNSILAYSVATGEIDPMVQMWHTFSPATPLLAVLGWGIAFLLDPSHKVRHAQAELESDLVDIHAQQLKEAAQTAEVQRTLIDGARVNASRYASKLTGGAVHPLPLANANPIDAPARDGQRRHKRSFPWRFRPQRLVRRFSRNGGAVEEPEDDGNPTTR